MTIAGLELLVGLIVLGSFAVFVWSLYTILTTPESTWKAAGMNQWMWLAVVIFLPLVGSVLFVANRPPSTHQRQKPPRRRARRHNSMRRKPTNTPPPS